MLDSIQKASMAHKVEVEETGSEGQGHAVLYFYRPTGRLQVQELIAVLERYRGGY